MKYSIFMIMLCFASCSSCKKEINALPEATQEGKNTGGFLINGQAWIPTGRNTIPSIRPMSGGYRVATLYRPKNSVQLLMYKNDGTSIQLFVRSVDKPGRYPLSFDTGIDLVQPDTKNFGLYAISGSMLNDPDYNYITTSIKTGYVNFTVADTLTGSLAGTFEFDAIDNPSGKTIKISDGRFDINTITLNK